MEKLRHDLAPSSRLVVRLLESPRKLLITILTGNTLVNVVLASTAALITARFADAQGANLAAALLLETIILTILLVILGEITPKVVAIRHPLAFASRIAGAMHIIFRLFAPIANVIYRVIERVVSFLGVHPEETFSSDEEIRTLAELGQDRGVIGEEEREMIDSIIEFGDTKAKEVMIPRPDIMMLNTGMDRDEILRTIRESVFSKYPLYKDQIDRILGIVYIKDILPYYHTIAHRINLERLARPALFVPEHQFIDEVLRHMQSQKQKVAMVVDEFGGIAGMVAVEDIVEEVLGDLQDELDKPEELEIEKIGASRFRVDASTLLDLVDEEVGLKFPEERDYDSIGGFIMDLTGRIPEAGETIMYGNCRIVVEKVHQNRIESLILEPGDSRQDVG